MSSERFTRSAIEQFLYHEAELIDDWRLMEWADLYSDDARYEIASLDAEDQLAADPRTSLFVLADDKARIKARASRLLKRSAHAEYPHSKVRHMTSNVRVGAVEAGDCAVKANFVVYRSRGDSTVRYMGEAHYVITQSGDSFLIRRKRIKLDVNTLREQGRITIIL